MTKNKILVFGSDTSVISPLKEHHDVDVVLSLGAALKRLEENRRSFVIIDCDVKELNGLSLYKDIRKKYPDVPVIMLSSNVTIPDAVGAARIGVSDFIKKPFLKERLLESVKKYFLHESVQIRIEIGSEAMWLYGSGHRIKSLFKNMETAISEKKDALFISEPGIDVMSLARIIHEYSGGAKKLATIDMIPFQREGVENIFWTVLQGVMIDTNAIFFENFGVLPASDQESIIDYVRNKAVGGQIKVMAAMRESPSSAMFESWEKINVPPLRERMEDMLVLLETYIGNYSRVYGKKVANISLDALGVLTRYSWPGNYRELECVIENAILACEKDAITLKEIQLNSRILSDNMLSAGNDDLRKFIVSIEKGLINIIYQKTRSEEETANLLDIPKSRVSDNLSK